MSFKQFNLLITYYLLLITYLMSLIKWNPMPVDSFDDMDRWLDWPTWRSSMNFTPAVDVYEDKDNVFVEAPIAGINPKDVHVSIENDVLTLEGKSEKKTEVDEKNYYRKEIRSGSFHRAVALPSSVDGGKAKAEYKDGVLKITVPKEEKAKPKAIEVEVK
jgi:HSP20 family protein